jgi:type IV secretory pathway VirB4 component
VDCAKPAHRATTAHLSALFPYVWSGDLGSEGAFVGTDLFGAPFYFDPIGMYAKPGLDLTDPNVLVLGQIGKGKSALLKCLARRLNVFGYRTTYLDPKGETAALAQAFGVTRLRPTPGGDLCLNPFDGSRTTADRELLMRSILGTVLSRDLTMGEQRALTEAVAALDIAPRIAPPTLSDLYRELTPKRLPGEDLSLALWNLIHGPARGLFDGPTTAGVDLEGPLVALDLRGLLERVASDQLRTITLTLAAAWLFGRAQTTAKRRLFVVDECWYLLRDKATAEWFQQQWKLARSLGTANVAVLHRLSDLDAAGVSADVARGLIADAQTRVIFRQDDSEVEHLRSWLGLSQTEIDCVLSLPRGWALWLVADRSFVVHLDVQASEYPLIYTDAALAEKAA